MSKLHGNRLTGSFLWYCCNIAVGSHSILFTTLLWCQGGKFYATLRWQFFYIVFATLQQETFHNIAIWLHGDVADATILRCRSNIAKSWPLRHHKKLLPWYCSDVIKRLPLWHHHATIVISQKGRHSNKWLPFCNVAAFMYLKFTLPGHVTFTLASLTISHVQLCFGFVYAWHCCDVTTAMLWRRHHHDVVAISLLRHHR